MPRRQRITSVVIMGVAGSGKSSVMAELAERLGWPTLEGDALHPAANVAKLAAGLPLSDADREPWLQAIAGWLRGQEARRQSSIVTCSALKRAYRDLLRQRRPWVWFVHLTAPPQLLAARMRMREGHFMPPSLLASQLEALEPLARDEPGMALESLETAAVTAERIVEQLGLDR